MEFSEKLRQLRNEKGISQTKLAADIHISRSAVANGRTAWDCRMTIRSNC